MAPHLDADELTELALQAGSRPTPRQRVHLVRCRRCREELRQLHRVVRAARDVSTEDLLVAPPPRVWDAITAELERGTRSPARTGSNTDASVRHAHPSRGRPWQRRPAMLLAAAGLAAGAALGSAVTWWQLDDDVPPVYTSRDSRLAPLAVPQAVGTARLVRSSPAGREVTVTVAGLPRTDGYYEVWLMDRTHTRLIAVGVLGPDGRATLPLPAGVDLSGYPLIDVSAQENDGNPAHSGQSVVRGSLPG
ncbi:anti-sigma factor [Streptomyces sp. NPDC093094]|uniref:anti-sigma factor n=1 Tax=Streptomyces sp. NPDC093094 TaxID=3366026 RepID=UPI003829FEAF